MALISCLADVVGLHPAPPGALSPPGWRGRAPKAASLVLFRVRYILQRILYSVFRRVTDAHPPVFVFSEPTKFVISWYALALSLIFTSVFLAVCGPIRGSGVLNDRPPPRFTVHVHVNRRK